MGRIGIFYLIDSNSVTEKQAYRVLKELEGIAKEYGYITPEGSHYKTEQEMSHRVFEREDEGAVVVYPHSEIEPATERDKELLIATHEIFYFGPEIAARFWTPVVRRVYKEHDFKTGDGAIPALYGLPQIRREIRERGIKGREMVEIERGE